MSFVVSARKYRPRKFEDVLGQEHITGTLKNALVSDKLAHAYLFTGPRGVGKTTCARILAQVINCENVQDSNPCGECGSCKSFEQNASFNIIELDAASNNSVDHIRTLNEQVRFQPQQGKYKVFIIDEVHMLSQAAFNAFLKTLEEPPPYAIFILATTEKHKIIPTILSRCQIYDFRRIKLLEMVKQMKIIADQEQVKIDDEALFLVSEKADGAMRDALSIFDRIVSSSDGTITYADVIDRLNILDYDYFFKISDEILKKDGIGCLKIYHEIMSKGFDGDQFLLGFSQHLRNLFVAKDPRTASIREGSKELNDRYSNQAQLFLFSDLVTALHEVNRSDVEYPKAKNKRLHVEIALLKLCYYKDRVNTGEASLTLEKKNSEPQLAAPTKPAIVREIKEVPPEPIPKVDNTSEVSKVNVPTPTSMSSEKVQEKAPELKAEEKPKANPVIPTKKEEKVETTIQNTPSLSSLDSILSLVKEENKSLELDREITLDMIQKVWEEYRVNQQSPSISSVLNKTVMEFEGKRLLVEIPSNVAKEIILQENELFEKIRTDLKFPSLELSVVVNKDKFPDIEVVIPKTYVNDREKLERMVENHPNVSKLINTFNLKIDE